MKNQYCLFLIFLLVLAQAKNMRRLSEEEFEFDGNYKDGKAEGKGTAKYKNGDKYEWIKRWRRKILLSKWKYI